MVSLAKSDKVRRGANKNILHILMELEGNLHVIDHPFYLATAHSIVFSAKQIAIYRWLICILNVEAHLDYQ